MKSEEILRETVESQRIGDYNYDLPDERIARHPLNDRDECRLLCCGADGSLRDLRFDTFGEVLPEHTLLVCNNTRVINARLRFHKPTGASIEIFLLEPVWPADYARMFQSRWRCRWRCLIGNLKRWKEGELTMRIPISDGQSIVLHARRLESMEGNSHIVELTWDNADLTLSEVIDAAGRIPIPPYLNRESEQSDYEDYQTVYSKIRGSVAAPTAGLHFTRRVLDDLERRGVERVELTLHVGAGTFQPVKTDTIGGHDMHTETYTISRQVLTSLIDAVKSGRAVTAVGTTSVRTLESLPYAGAHLLSGRDPHVDQWEAYAPTSRDIDTLTALGALLDYMESRGTDTFTSTTAIMIAPGFEWRLTDAMVTNFHQPQSTLLLLVSSFLGLDPEERPRWKRIYRHALERDYRFLSYGDACLFYRNMT